MRKSIKLLALIMALLMVFALCACNGNTENQPQGTDEDEDGANAAGDNILTMATNAAFPPYEYLDGDQIVGIDPEIAALIADKLGMELQIVDVDFGVIVTSVQSGKYDMGMAGMTVNEERLENVNFSTSYATGIQVIIVSEDSSITSPDDLADVKIGVQENTTGHLYCEEDYGADHVTPYTTGANAVQALITGKVDAVVIDNEPAKAFVDANKGLKILDTQYAVEDYAICIAKENNDFLGKVNTALEELINDGSVQAILDKYIKAE